MRRLLLGAIIPASFLVIWEASSRTGLLTLESLSRPSDIVVAGYAALRDGTLLLATLQTCETALLGLAIAAVMESRSGPSSASCRQQSASPDRQSKRYGPSPLSLSCRSR